ncbi:MAG: VapC ribonuclease R02377 [Alphaproteobacteria bacterium]|nr:MAG: VapC ribonuclease R02377 [Alphaproteobacteria bacterium]
MFVDASAIVAVLNEEAGQSALVKRLDNAARRPVISPVVRFEAILGLARAIAGKKRVAADAGTISDARRLVDEFIEVIGAEEIAITIEIGDRAIEAAMIYGKVVAHPARLNFGDCFAYACAKSLAVPLLYKGDDFARTDLAG